MRHRPRQRDTEEVGTSMELQLWSYMWVGSQEVASLVLRYLSSLGFGLDLFDDLVSRVRTLAGRRNRVALQRRPRSDLRCMQLRAPSLCFLLFMHAYARPPSRSERAERSAPLTQLRRRSDSLDHRRPPAGGTRWLRSGRDSQCRRSCCLLFSGLADRGAMHSCRPLFRDES